MICALALNTRERRSTPLAADAGIRRRVLPDQGFERWVELMELVEALSPRWPPRLRPEYRDWRL